MSSISVSQNGIPVSDLTQAVIGTIRDLFQQKKYEEAIQLGETRLADFGYSKFSHAESAKQDNAHLRYELANCYEQKAKEAGALNNQQSKKAYYRKAAKHLEAGLRTAEHIDSLHLLKRIYKGLDEAAKAEAVGHRINQTTRTFVGEDADLYSHPVLATKAVEMLNQHDLQGAEKIAKTMITRADELGDGPLSDKYRRDGLQILTHAHFEGNDLDAASKTADELIKLIKETTEGNEYNFCMARAYQLAGYVKLAQGDAENAVILAEESQRLAIKLPSEMPERDLLRGCALSLLGYATGMQEDLEMALLAAEEKIALTLDTMSPGKNRNIALMTAHSMRAMILLEQEKTDEARDVIRLIGQIEGGEKLARLCDAYADIQDGYTGKAFDEALRLVNQNEHFDHLQMSLLRYAAYKAGRNNDYAGLLAIVKQQGALHPDDSSYEPINGALSPAEELEESIGRYARSAISHTQRIIRPIDSTAAHIVGLHSRPIDDYRRSNNHPSDIPGENGTGRY